MSRPVGGYKKRAWRLKKKHKKWFAKMTEMLITITLADLPPGHFEGVWASCGYDACRIYK